MDYNEYRPPEVIESHLSKDSLLYRYRGSPLPPPYKHSKEYLGS